MRRALALACVAVGALVAAGVSSAAKGTQVLTCDGGVGTITIVSATGNGENAVAWGIGKVSSSLHLIPVSFSATATDMTTNTVVGTFTQAKGQGNGMHNEPTVTCSTPSQTGTAAELGVDGPGVAPGDTVEIDFAAQAVIRP